MFDTYDTIIDAACEAWRKLIAEPQTITSNRNAGLVAGRSIQMTVGIRLGALRCVGVILLQLRSRGET